MSDKIKTKQMIRTIKPKEIQIYLKSYIKNQQIKTRKAMTENTDENSSVSNKSEVIAVNHVSNSFKIMMNESYGRSKNIIKNQQQKIKSYGYDLINKETGTNKSKIKVSKSHISSFDLTTFYKIRQKRLY